MMAKTYEMLYYGGLIAALVLFTLAVILFFTLKIHRVVGELTGRSAKRGVREMKNRASAQDLNKKERAKYYNNGGGKITAHEAESTKKSEQKTTILGGRKKGRNSSEETTVILDPSAQEETAVLSAEPVSVAQYEIKPDTEVLTAIGGEDSETAVLATAGVEGDDTATDVLSEIGDDTATDVLASTKAEQSQIGLTDEGLVQTEEPPLAKSNKVKFIYDVVVTHTEEKLDS